MTARPEQYFHQAWAYSLLADKKSEASASLVQAMKKGLDRKDSIRARFLSTIDSRAACSRKRCPRCTFAHGWVVMASVH